MNTKYTVKALPRETKYKEKIYKNVYDIGHFYERDMLKKEPSESIRLLIGEPFGKTEREYIDLSKYDVMIHMEVE